MSRSIKTLLVLTISICFLLTVLDIIIVETYYRPTFAWNKIWQWHNVFILLIYSLPLVTSVLTKSLIPFTSLVYFFFGIEDTFYYSLQGYLPEIYWGVAIMGIWEPKLNYVMMINIFGVVLMIILMFMFHIIEAQYKVIK